MAPKMLYWEDVAEGTEIPSISLELSVTRLVMGVCGTRDIYPLHHDRDFARSMGQKDMVASILFLGAFLGRCITDWTGPTGKIRKMNVVASTPSYPGDTITAGGRVTRKYASEGDNRVDCLLTVARQDASTVITCRATVILPARSPTAPGAWAPRS